MDYSLYHVVGAVCLGGAIGGLLNSMLVGSLSTPVWKGTEFDPGWLKNVFIGLVAGFVSWLPSLSTFAAVGHVIVPADLIGACGSTILVGISGAKWLTAQADQQKAESDQNQLKSAVVEAATKIPDIAAAQRIAGASKVQDIVNIVKGLKDS
jgi:hypothetical protein